jgi:hypothetical protein
MARSSEARPKVIKIPILIEDNNSSSGGQQQQQQAGCGNWPPGGQPEEAAAATAASWRTTGEPSGRREAAGGARTRIIPIRLSDNDRLGSSSTDGHSPVIVASGGEGTGVGAAHGRQRPGGSDTAAAGISGLRARLAGSRTNSVEEAARPPSSVKVEIGGSSARGSGTSPLPPSSSEMAETLVKASSASASDIWYVKQFET